MKNIELVKVSVTILFYTFQVFNLRLLAKVWLHEQFSDCYLDSLWALGTLSAPILRFKIMIVV